MALCHLRWRGPSAWLGYRLTVDVAQPCKSFDAINASAVLTASASAVGSGGIHSAQSATVAGRQRPERHGDSQCAVRTAAALHGGLSMQHVPHRCALCAVSQRRQWQCASAIAEASHRRSLVHVLCVPCLHPGLPGVAACLAGAASNTPRLSCCAVFAKLVQRDCHTRAPVSRLHVSVMLTDVQMAATCGHAHKAHACLCCYQHAVAYAV